MRHVAAGALILVFTLAIVCDARVLGVFQGRIVEEPFTAGKKRWLTVQSRNGAVRRVNITKASVEYDEAFPAAARMASAAMSLCHQYEVRVSAYQAASRKGDGEWSAVEILVLKPPIGIKTVLAGTSGGRCGG